MLRRSLLKRPLSLAGLPQMISRCGVAIGVVSGMLFVVPSANAASCNIPESFYKNVSCTASSSYFLATKDSGTPVALINRSGKRVVDLSRYQNVDADRMSGGLLPVMRNGHIGYINMQGREVIPAIYDILRGGQIWARPVSEGRIVVKKSGNYGVINTANKTIVPFSASFSDIDDFRGGVARVRKNSAVSWLDVNGKTANDPNSTSETTNTNVVQAETRLTRPSNFTTLQPRQQDGKWGFVDDNNVVMITYSFDEVRSFSEGLAGVRIGEDWGFIDLGGALLIPFRFADSGVSTGTNYKGGPSFTFVDGKAWIGNLKNGTKMCVNTTGDGVRCD